MRKPSLRKGGFFCVFLPKFAVEMLKMRLSCDFLKKVAKKFGDITNLL